MKVAVEPVVIPVKLYAAAAVTRRITDPEPDKIALTSYNMFAAESPPVLFTLLHATLMNPPIGAARSLRQTIADDP